MVKMKSFLKLMLVAGLAFGIFFGIGTGLTRLLATVNATDDPGQQDQEEQSVAEEEGKRTSILVLGVDARPGDDHYSRADTILLATIDPKLDKAAIVSIPRDTKATFKNGQVDKINAANTIGGPEYAVDAVERLMNTSIDYYVEMDFNGFEDIVDALGGVNINVPQQMKKLSEGINLNPGQQKLNGSQALQYVRFRDYPMGDIQRTAAQQEFLEALANEVLKPTTIPKLHKLVKTIDQCTDTNLKLTDMLKIASWAPGFSKDSLITQTLPGAFYDERDSQGTLLASYWLADEKHLANLVDNMLAGKTIEVVQGSSTTVVASAPADQEQGTSSAGYAEPADETGESRDLDNDEASITPEDNDETGSAAGNHHKTKKPVNPPGGEQQPEQSHTGPTPENTQAEEEAEPAGEPAVSDPAGPAGYI